MTRIAPVSDRDPARPDPGDALDGVASVGALVADGVLELDAADAITYANDVAARLIGAASAHALVGRDAADALRHTGHGSAAFALQGAIARARGGAARQVAFTVHDTDGAPTLQGAVSAHGDGAMVVLRRARPDADTDTRRPTSEGDAVVAMVGALAAAGDDAVPALDRLAESARVLLAAEGACVVTLDAAGDAGCVDATAGSFASMRGQRTALLAAPSPLRRAIDERRVVSTNGQLDAPRAREALGAGVRHVVVAPLVVDDAVVAVLCAINSTRGGFGPDDADVAERLAEHGALVLRTHRLHLAAEQGGREARLLGAAAHAVARHPSDPAVFAALADVAREALGISGFTTMLADPATGRLERLYGEGAGESVFGATDVAAFWNGAGGRAVRDALPAFVNGGLGPRPTVVDRAVARTLDAAGVRAFALLPFGATTSRGLLTLAYAAPRAFGDAERALLEGFATHVGAAAHAVTTAGERARDRARAAAANAIARVALDATDLAAGAASMLAVLDGLVPTPGKALCVHRAGEQVAECIAATGTASRLRGLRVPCPDLGTGADAEPIVIADVRAKLGPAFRGRGPAESAVLFPLVARGRPIGDVSVLTPLGAPLEGPALDTLRQLAASVALALDALTLADASRRRSDAEDRIDEQLRQTEKMVALGELVAGVAHEINNPLTGISAFAEILLEDELTESQRESARLIKREADRAVNVVRDLLAFSRKTEPTYDALDLNALLERTLRLHAYALRAASVEVTLDLDDDLPLAHGDEAKLQQVVLNLLLNAEYAMRDAPVRRLQASTRVVGGRLVLAVSDTGSGIPSDVLPRIFEPFFTTKPAGDGTGLGLSVSYGIVQAHGGELRAHSAPGGGTTFEVVLLARVRADESHLHLESGRP